MKMVLLRKELREGRWKSGVGGLLLIATALAVPLLYDMIVEMVTGMPEEQLAYFVPDLSLVEDRSLYLWSQWNGKNLYQIGAALAVVLGMGAVAGEVSRKTVSFLLTRPVSRSAVFFSKALAGIILIILPVLVSTLVLIVASARVFQGVSYGRLLGATVITALGLVVIYSFSLLISTVVHDSIRAGVISGLLLILWAVPGWFSATRTLSLFTHITGGEFFLEGGSPLPVFLGFLVLSTVFLCAGWAWFSRREF